MPAFAGATMGLDAIAKTKEYANELLKLKFPNDSESELQLQLTCPLEIKYDLFTQHNGIIKTGHLSNSQVFN